MEPSGCIVKWAGVKELGPRLLLNKNSRDFCKIHFSEINTVDPCDSLIEHSRIQLFMKRCDPEDLRLVAICNLNQVCCEVPRQEQIT